MRDRPSASELVEATREFLEQEVLPTLADQRLRFRALVAINALIFLAMLTHGVSFTSPNGFQDHRHRPLGEPSWGSPAYGNPERDVSRRGQASPSPTTAARARYASAVSLASSSSSISAPSSRCAS